MIRRGIRGTGRGGGERGGCIQWFYNTARAQGPRGLLRICVVPINVFACDNTRQAKRGQQFMYREGKNKPLDV